jgi:hypothetical protein
MTRIETLKPSKKKKLVEESINDYHLLLNYLMRYHSKILRDFQETFLKRPIKTGLRIGWRNIKDE